MNGHWVEQVLKPFDVRRRHVRIPVESDDIGWCDKTKCFLVSADRLTKHKNEGDAE